MRDFPVKTSLSVNSYWVSSYKPSSLEPWREILSLGKLALVKTKLTISQRNSIRCKVIREEEVQVTYGLVEGG